MKKTDRKIGQASEFTDGTQPDDDWTDALTDRRADGQTTWLQLLEIRQTHD